MAELSADTHFQSAPFEIAGRRIFPDRNEAVVNGARRRLEPRHMKVLQCLAREAGEAVAREDLLEAGWGAQIVGDDSLTQAISRLRRALDDRRGDGRLIETIPKTGYRLTCAVSPVADRVFAQAPRRPVPGGAASWMRAHARAALFAGAALVCAAAFGWRASDLVFAPQPAQAQPQAHSAEATPDAPQRRIILLRSFAGPGGSAPLNRPQPVDL